MENELKKVTAVKEKEKTDLERSYEIRISKLENLQKVSNLKIKSLTEEKVN